MSIETQPLLLHIPPTPHLGHDPTFDTEAEASLVQATGTLDDDALPETAAVGRQLGWQDTYILIISRVFGSGIFATPGTIVRSVGSPGLALTLWLVGALIAAFGLSISLEFGTMLPRSGGDKVYLEFTYRWPRFLTSTLVAVYVVLLGFTASNAVIFSRYALFALGHEEASEALRRSVAVGLLTLVVVVHVVIPGWGVKIQNVLGWVKIGIISFMILSGLYVVAFSSAITRGRFVTGTAVGAGYTIKAPMPSSLEEQATSVWQGWFQGSVWNWSAISTSLFKVFYSYSGLETANNVVNEIKNPIHTLKSATTAGLATCCVLYVLTNIAYFTIVPIDEIKASGEMIAALFFERVFGAALGRRILPLSIALSAGGNVMVVAFAMARLKQEIARQGLLPYGEFLSSTRPFHSPLGALIIHWIPSVLVITMPPSEQVYDLVLEVEGYPAQLFAMAVAAGLIILRYRRPDLKRPFKAWIPGVYIRILLSLALLSAPFFPPEQRFKDGIWYAAYAVISMGILAMGVVYWFIWAMLLPWLYGYHLQETSKILSDGTSITKIIRIEAE
ncbi:High-affinity methionine permease [Ceratocystis fimbriata CBS 114723]|uniref:High-affinity methionine permease n=1 Tax=Ceratocystis fimbriata CBS 114723 TaxID=1035309 RepID=A0A2C5WUM5_9PEZI|nr:High-affinity methionine permease [Ceratocystis fimbriata CBS 114723]